MNAKLKAVYQLLKEEARSEALRLLIKRFEQEGNKEAVQILRRMQAEQEEEED